MNMIRLYDTTYEITILYYFYNFLSDSFYFKLIIFIINIKYFKYLNI